MEVVTPNYLPRNPSFPARLKSYATQASPAMSSGPTHQSSATAAHSSTHSQPSSLRSSDSTAATQVTSTSTLFSPPPLPTGTPLPHDTNVLNKRADKEASLFQICKVLRLRLQGVPGFEKHLQEEEEDGSDGEDIDPVTLLWRTFRRGYPLLTIYNALGPTTPLVIDEDRVKPEKRAQAATAKFLNACTKELMFPTEDCFIISDLFLDDTTGFVKVAKVVNRVLDVLVREGVLSPDAGAAEAPEVVANIKRTKRQHIVEELVNTERTYVQHLELLQDFKKLVEERGVITGDAVHNIFLNLNALLDFQRRFLIRVEQVNALPEEDQDWASPFILYQAAFTVYEPYIANQKICEELVIKEFDKLRETGGPPEMRQMVESPTVLSAFLLKPFQRLTKYPLLLRDLRDKAETDEVKKEALTQGIAVAEAILRSSNAAIDQQERNEAVHELRERVEDWKGHRLDSFGDLLLHGTFSVIKGEASSKDQEREYKIYLFAMILLCCKEMDPRKQKNKVIRFDRKGRPRLQLKGRIFMQNVTDTVMSSKPGHYTCQIFWKGDPGIEYFTIRFTSEDTMRKWAAQVEEQRRRFLDATRISQSAKYANVSATQLVFMESLGPLENPYKEMEDEDEDDATSSNINGAYDSGYPYGRNESRSSGRSRSTTGESGPPMGRLPPRQFPMGSQTPALQVQTQPQMSQQAAPSSPNEWIMDSYFSPNADSPMSTRSSGQSGMFPFPRQALPPLPHGPHMDEHNRFTAPPHPRQASRDGSLNGYQVNARNAMQRPSLPPTAASSQSIAQARMRSASSPDIQTPVSARRVANPSQNGVPDLPPFPTHYAFNPAMLNRSQSSSPQAMQLPPGVGHPMRALTQSQGVSQQTRAVHPRSVPLQVYPEYSGLHGHVPPAPRGVQPMDRGPGAQGQPEMRSITPSSSVDSRAMTPSSMHSASRAPAVQAMPPRQNNSEDYDMPTQFRVKVHCPTAGTSMTLVVMSNIEYETLKSRINQKLERSANLSLSSGQFKLKYKDEDDFVSIQSNEDVQMAFETWREQNSSLLASGVGGAQFAEIDFYVQ